MRNKCKVCLDFLMIILSHHCVRMLLARMLIWASFSQSMCTFSFCINHWYALKEYRIHLTEYALKAKCDFEKMTPYVFVH